VVTFVSLPQRHALLQLTGMTFILSSQVSPLCILSSHHFAAHHMFVKMLLTDEHGSLSLDLASFLCSMYSLLRCI
jgi:hypothetical protein